MPDEPAPAPQQTDAPAINIFPVLMVNFIATLGFSIVIPFLVYLVRGWGGNEVVYGFVAATYPAMQLIGAPLLGRWSDMVGRRKVLFVSQLGTLLSWVLFLMAFFMPETSLFSFAAGTFGTITLTLPVLVMLAARALDGLTGGNISVANAYVGDITTEADRNKNYGRLAISGNMGFIVGPALAGVLTLTPLGNMLPVIAAILISLVATLAILFYLPDSRNVTTSSNRASATEDEAKPADKQEPAAHSTPSWKTVLAQPNITVMLILQLLIMLAFNLFYTSFPNHAISGLDWEVAQVGLFFTLISFSMIIVQGPVLSQLSKSIPSPWLVTVGALLMSCCFGMLAGVDVVITYTSIIFFSMGNGLMWPSYLALLSKTGDKKVQGAVQGLAGGIGSFAGIVGLILGGVLYSAIAEATFWCCAVVMLITAGFGFYLVRLDTAVATVTAEESMN